MAQHLLYRSAPRDILLTVRRLFSALLLLTALACSGRIDPAVDGPTRGAIVGSVQVLATGASIGNASVLLTPGDVEIVADADGLFALSDLAPGTYTLTVTAGTAPCTVSTTHEVDVVAGQTQPANVLIGNAEGIRIPVLAIAFDPILEAQGSQRLHELMGWNDPADLMTQFVDTSAWCSGFYANMEIVEYIVADEFPVKTDGFSYTDAEYLDVINGVASPHVPDEANPAAIVANYGLEARVDSGEIDQVLIFGADYFGFPGVRMAGPNAIGLGVGPVVLTNQNDFIISGFNYTPNLHPIGAMMLRAEVVMDTVYGPRNLTDPQNHWDAFTAVDVNVPGNSGCGDADEPPNAISPGQFDSSTTVDSRCEQYVTSWPDPGTSTTPINRDSWSPTGTDYRTDFQRWWLAHLPATEGTNADGKLNNWWKYIAQPHRTLP